MLLLWCVASLATGAELTRGPSLQLAGPDEITIVFRTSTVASAEVHFGERGLPRTGRVVELTPGTEHVLHLTGLTPLTSYDYEVIVDGIPLASGDTQRFRTYPARGTSAPFRFFAWGDSGTGTNAQLRVAERLSRDADEATFSLILGDIIYYLGEPELYDARFFHPYAALLRRMVVWPTIGNHDVGLDPRGGPYLDAFSLPTNNPEHTELYYSFDYGDAHFVCLDTHVSGHQPGSPQLTWLAQDLAASNAKWKFVFFHVPPYSGGTHPDDLLVRSAIVPLLEAAGVDAVFTGHSHVYERTYLLRGNTIMQDDRSSYSKPTSDAGTVYLVAGTAGQSGSVFNPRHPLMAFQAGNVLGAMVIDVNGDELRGYLRVDDGTATDLFRLQKGPDVTPPRIVTVRSISATELEVVFDEPVFGGFGPGGAERLSAWDLTPRLRVTNAQLSLDQRTVKLTTSAQLPGDYTVSAIGIGDRSGNGNLSSAIGRWSWRERVTLTEGKGVRFLNGTPLADWREPIADETAWTAADLPIGYGEDGLATTVSATTGLFVRVPFVLPEGARERLRELELDLDYDDGFVASLNGVEVLRQNVTSGRETASAERERGFVQHFVLAPRPASILRDGVNVLAIEVRNSSQFSGDLFLSVRLRAQLDSTDGGVMLDAGVPRVPEPADAGVVITVPISGGCACGNTEWLAAALALFLLGRRAQRSATAS